MIGFSRSDVAKKYAQAYLNVCAQEHTFEDYCSMWRAAQFLSEHHSLLFYLSLSIIDEVDKKRFIDLLFEKFHLFPSLKQLFYLLLKNKAFFRYFQKTVVNLHQGNSICSSLSISLSENSL